jgi:hypothetical protein
MNIESMEPALQWIFCNIILIWICHICVLFYASCTEPIINDLYIRIQRLELQNRAIGEALEKLNDLLARPFHRDEILDLRHEIASLKTELQKQKSKNVNRRRIIESDDEDQ